MKQTPPFKERRLGDATRDEGWEFEVSCGECGAPAKIQARKVRDAKLVREGNLPPNVLCDECKKKG